MDAPPASPRARKDSSLRVSEGGCLNDQDGRICVHTSLMPLSCARGFSAVRSLRQNLDRKYPSQPEAVRPASSKVRRQIAAFENSPASALDRVEKASLSVRGTIAAFERSDSGISSEPPSTSAPPMTPSRKAAIAARKVTRSQKKLLVPEPEEDPGVPLPGQCTTPRKWPEVRRRKALFESSLSNNTTDLESQPNEKRNAKMSAGKKQASVRKSQRLESSSAPAANAEANEDEQVERVDEEEPAADMMDVDEAPVSTPNPFIDDDEVKAAAVVPSSGIFASAPASPARKSKRVASRTALAAVEPEETVAPVANPTAENEHAMAVALPNKAMTATDGVTHPAPAMTPRTPTKVVMPTSEQKAAIKTPVKSARKSARKLRAEDISAAPTPGTPSKVTSTEGMELALEDVPEQQEIEEEQPVAPSSVRKSARKSRVAPSAVEEDSATLAPSVPTTPSRAKRGEAASEVAAATEQNAEEPPMTPRSVRKSARKPSATAEIPATTPNRVTFAQRLESAALQEETHAPATGASPARKSARKPQTPRAAPAESEITPATAGVPATPNRVTFVQRLESAALQASHETAAVASPARKSARKSQTPARGGPSTESAARPAMTPNKVTFPRSLDESSSDDEDAAAEPRPKVPATPARVSARLAAASPHVARVHAQPAVLLQPPATPAASTVIAADETFQTAPATPGAVVAETFVTAPASTKRKRTATDDDDDEHDRTTADDAIAPAAESATTTETTTTAAVDAAAAAPASTTSNTQPFVRKRRRMLEILPTPKKTTASSSLAPSSAAAARRVKQQQQHNVALPVAVDSPPRNWVSTPVSPLGSRVVQMDVDGEEEEQEEEEEEEEEAEGEGGWLLSVFFKAARKVGLL
ncbi:hypothetical protein HDU87_001524 [Geranomyces variabilis]|uniref:Uncharacterized protein n=1 Tax=Geranomyces variabilis TaxID=109894 RepID=A0AAD5TP03_9FUNG|nr:hypothetical protein HDU87_001524 [Geranomyces variabilis]